MSTRSASKVGLTLMMMLVAGGAAMGQGGYGPSFVPASPSPHASPEFRPAGQYVPGYDAPPPPSAAQRIDPGSACRRVPVAGLPGRAVPGRRLQPPLPYAGQL